MGMGRKRKHRKDLPLRMRFKHGAYYLRSQSSEIHLGRDYQSAMKKYAEINNGQDLSTISALIDGFVKHKLKDRAPRTQKNYLHELKFLRAVFGAMQPEDLLPKDIYGYKSARPRVSANREIALLSTVMQYGIELGLIHVNPCRSVKRNKETPRDRYVTDEEFQAVRAIATESIRLAMDIAYQTGLRMADILKLTLRDVSEAGITIRTNKDRKNLVFEWTPELRGVVERSRERKITGLALVCTRDGGRYTESGFKSVWQRLIVKAYQTGVISERFQFRDLRGKTGSDSDDAQKLLAHNNAATTNRHYRRKPKVVTPLRPKF